MNDQYDVLERSLLGDHTGLVASNNDAISIAERRPYIYGASLALATLLGYGFLFIFPLTLIVLAITVPGSIIEARDKLDVAMVLSAIAIAGFAAWISWYLYKVRPTLPAGRPLRQDEAPLLFELIEEARKEYGAPTIHRVRIIQSYEIEMVKTPKNGFPLVSTNTLLIGLPLLQSLSPRQLNLAVRREIIHLAGLYKRPYGWVFFLRKIWCQYRNLHQNGWHPASIIMRAFFCWYAPLFKLISQAANREEEFYADRLVNFSDRNFTLIEMLASQSIHRRYLDEQFWPELLNTAYKHPRPPYLPYASMEKSLRNRLDNQTAQLYLDAAMAEQDIHSDTPALKQRLSRLGMHTVLLPEIEAQSATRYFTAPALELIVGQMDRIWFKSSQYDWQQKFRTGQAEQSKLVELRLQAKQGLLSNSRAWEYIQLIKKYIQGEQALALYKQVLAIDTDDARISYDIGRTLLEHMDRQGIQALEDCIQKDASYTVMACQLITEFFVRAGDSRSAQAYRRKALAYQVEAA